jgi:hypothetical protein
MTANNAARVIRVDDRARIGSVSVAEPIVDAEPGNMGRIGVVNPAIDVPARLVPG